MEMRYALMPLAQYLAVGFAGLFLTVALNRCDRATAHASEPNDFHCVDIQPAGWQRCENQEAICYSTPNGISCKWRAQ